MRKDEAESLLREIRSKCSELNEQTAIVLPPGPSDTLSHGYQLKIQANLSGEAALCIKSVAQKKGLATTREPLNQTLIIYSPIGAKILHAEM